MRARPRAPYNNRPARPPTTVRPLVPVAAGLLLYMALFELGLPLLAHGRPRYADAAIALLFALGVGTPYIAELAEANVSTGHHHAMLL